MFFCLLYLLLWFHESQRDDIKRKINIGIVLLLFYVEEVVPRCHHLVVGGGVTGVGLPCRLHLYNDLPTMSVLRKRGTQLVGVLIRLLMCNESYFSSSIPHTWLHPPSHCVLCNVKTIFAFTSVCPLHSSAMAVNNCCSSR